MSNRVYIETTVFDYIKTGKKDYGVVISDDSESFNVYMEDEAIEDDLELFTKILDVDSEAVNGMFDYVYECEKGIYINDTFYDFSEIQSILKVHFERKV